MTALTEYAEFFEETRNNWTYLEPEEKLIRLSDMTEFTVSGFNRTSEARELSRLKYLADSESTETDAAKPKHVSGFELIIDSLRRTTARVMVFGGERLLRDHEIDGIKHDALNDFRGTSLIPAESATDADIAPYLNHVRAFAGPDADMLLDWCAWIVQNPRKKIRWGPLIYSEQGVGKDTFCAPLHKIFGPHNTIEVTPEVIESNFNAYDKCKFIVLPELKSSSRYSTYEAIKPKISGTGSSFVTVNEKHKPPYKALNLQAWLTFTNHSDAMPMDPRDRRLWVINAKDPIDITNPDAVTAYYNALWDFLLDQNGFALVFRWLIERNVTGFRPNQPPPQNEAKKEMTLAAMTDIGRWLNSECEVGHFRSRQVVTNREIERLAANAGYGSDKLTPRKISEGMKSAGWVCLGSHPILGGADVITQKSTWWVSPVTRKERGDKFAADHRRVMMAEVPAGMKPHLGM